MTLGLQPLSSICLYVSHFSSAACLATMPLLPSPFASRSAGLEEGPRGPSCGCSVQLRCR